jgi:16S rRNA processing protein RimM
VSTLSQGSQVAKTDDFDDTPAWPEDAVEVGCIVDAWGIQGGIKVKPFSSDPQALFSSRRWLLKVTQAREQGALVVARVQDVADRNAAEALRGARIFISRQSFPTAKEGEYYWIDLIGLAVVNREGEALGTVIDLLDTGVHCVLRVQRPDAPADAKPDEAERLIPFVDAYVDKVDLAERRITVDWGLDY